MQLYFSGPSALCCKQINKYYGIVYRNKYFIKDQYFSLVDKQLQRDSTDLESNGLLYHGSVRHPLTDQKPLTPPPVRPRARQSSRQQHQIYLNKAVSLTNLAQSQPHIKSRVNSIDAKPQPQICRRTNTFYQDGHHSTEMFAPDVTRQSLITATPPIHYPADVRLQ